MSSISIHLPDSLLFGLQQVSAAEGIEIEQFITSAIAEKLSVFLSETYLQDRAARGSREKFLAVLDKVPNVDPEKHDRISISA